MEEYQRRTKLRQIKDALYEYGDDRVSILAPFILLSLLLGAAIVAYCMFAPLVVSKVAEAVFAVLLTIIIAGIIACGNQIAKYREQHTEHVAMNILGICYDS